MKKTKLIKRNDVIIVISVIIISLMILAFSTPGGNAVAEVYKDGSLIYSEELGKIKQEENRLTVTYEDGASQVFELPDWWFGTRREYNGLSKTERTEKSLYFIEEGT